MKTMNNIKNDTANSDTVDLDSLIVKLKQRDEKQKKSYKRFSIMLLVLVIFYFLLLVANPDPALSPYIRISGLCYVAAFLVGAYLFRQEQKKLTKTDYTGPLLEVMKGAVERYRPFNKVFFRFLLVPLLVDLGITIGDPARFIPGNWTTAEKILILQAAYWSIMVIAGLTGYLIWRNRVKPYREAVNRMIADLEVNSGEI